MIKNSPLFIRKFKRQSERKSSTSNDHDAEPISDVDDDDEEDAIMPPSNSGTPSRSPSFRSQTSALGSRSRSGSCSNGVVGPINLAVPRDAQSFELRRTLDNLKDVGQLRVRLVRAEGLYAADFGGKSDPFAVIRLGQGTKYESKTIPKTLNPEWNEEYFFNITDISDMLYVRIYDRDRFHDPEYLGGVVIPLLKIPRSPLEQVFALKDKKFDKRARGNHPRVTLRFEIQWNKVRAAVKAIEDHEVTPQDPFSRLLFVANVQRLRKVLNFCERVNDFLTSCFEWENPWRSVKAFLFFECMAYFFEPYLLPIMILVFVFAYPIYADDAMLEEWFDSRDALSSQTTEDAESDDEKEGNKTIAEKLKTVQEVSAFVQNNLGLLASSAERLKNLMNFSVPYFSWTAVAFLVFSAIVFYMFPLRVLVMLWGVNKFSKKLINPNYETSSEFVSFLARVPDDPTLHKSKILSVYDPVLLKIEEEERTKKKVVSSLAKRVSSLFSKSEPASNSLKHQGSFKSDAVVKLKSDKDEAKPVAIAESNPNAPIRSDSI